MKSQAMHVVALFIGAIGFNLSANATGLDGCWRMESLTFSKKDGNVERKDGNCLRQYFSDKMTTICNGGKVILNQIEYKSSEEYIETRIGIFYQGRREDLPAIQGATIAYLINGNNAVLTVRPNSPEPTVLKVVHTWKIAPIEQCEAELGAANALLRGVAKLAPSTQPTPPNMATSVPMRVTTTPAPGKYGAPALLGFQVGAQSDAAVAQLNGLASEGFEIAHIARVTDETGTSSGMVAQKGLRGEGTPESFVVLLYEPGSSVRVVVRGESFSNMPFRDDFAASLKSKFSAPSWAMDAITKDMTGPVPIEPPVWGVTNGKAVKLAECYSGTEWQKLGKGFLHQASGRNYMKLEWRSLIGKGLTEAKPGYCQYAVLLRVGTNIVSSTGKNVGQQVTDYSIAIVDMAAAGSDAVGKVNAAASKEQAERDKLRKSATKPAF